MACFGVAHSGLFHWCVKMFWLIFYISYALDLELAISPRKLDFF